MARTLSEVQDEFIATQMELAQNAAKLSALTSELYSVQYGFYPGEPVDMDEVPGVVYFDGPMLVFQSNNDSLNKVYLKDGSKLKKKL